MGVALIAAIAFTGLTGCGEPVEDINRVQPHYLTKANLLDGEWYFRQTIVDNPPHLAFAFNGIEGGLEKVRWEIRESQLIAYRVHPAIEGLEDDSTHEGADFKGDPVAIFTITSHFDIIRDFDLVTGEQSNLLVENSSLRPWFERDYMRVDWRSNTIAGPVHLGMDNAGLPRNAYQVHTWDRDTDKFNPDHLQVTDDFIFLTLRAMQDAWYGCVVGHGMPTAGGWDNCGDVDVKVRFAFSKIDPDEAAQFEPKSYLDREEMHDENGQPIRYVTLSLGPDKDQMRDVACTEEVLEALGPEITVSDCRDLGWDNAGRFGYFRTYRNRYDRRAGGGHDHNRSYFANHHQIWKKTKNADGTRIAETDRELRPVIYYLNANFPENLKAVSIKIANNWNDVFMSAAMAATGRTASEIGAQLEGDLEGHPVFLGGDTVGGKGLFQVRENNCSGSGIAGYISRNPSMQDVVNEASRGQGVLPGTLESICSGLTHQSRERGVEEFVWQQMGDLRFSYMWWVNEAQPSGPLGYGPSSADMETGRIISGNAHIYGAAIDSYARSATDVVQAINGDLDLHELIDGHSYLEWIERGTTVADNPAEPSAEFQEEISNRIGSDKMSGYRPFMGENGKMDKAAMLRHMKDRLRRPSLDDPMAPAMNAPLNEGHAKLDALKADPRFRSYFMDENMLRLLGPSFGWVPGQDIPEEMSEMAVDLAINPDAMRKRQMERYKFFADNNVMLGDFIDDSVVGLAMELKGLDSEAVFTRLREEIYEAVMLHEIGHTVGMTHNFKASFDALNYQDEFWEIRDSVEEAEWNDARLPEYRYTSIMDYGSRFNSDMKGLGKYDFATIKYLYGGHAEVFGDAVEVPGRLDLELEFADYTRIPDMLGGTDNMKARQDRKVTDLVAEKKAGVLRNAELLVENQGRPAADFWFDRTVPYYYCADFMNGDLKCRTWDEGSNQTEAVQSAIQRYWNYYIFNSFRRGREAGSFVNSFFGRQSRLRGYLTYPWKYYYFYDAYPVDLRDDLLQASLLGINFVNQVIGTPEPGNYCRYTEKLYLPASWFNRSTQQECSNFEVGIGPGRDQYLKFNDNHLYDIDYIGTFYDKMNLMFSLVDPSTRFFKITDDSDNRQYSIGYYKVFKDELLKLTRDMLMGTMTNRTYVDGQNVFLQDSIYGAVVDADGELRPQLLVDPTKVNTAERATPSELPQIYTSMPFNVATRAVLYGAILNTSRFDQQLDLIEYLTISEDGSGDARDTGEDADIARFVHPVTGQSYSATQTADGKSIAYELIQTAQSFVTTDWEPMREAIEADPDDEEFQRNFEYVDRQLQDFAEMMDYLRELRAAADWGQF
jgi:hypothetical protein